MSGKCQNDRLLFICKGDGYVDIAELPSILEKAGLSREGVQNTRYDGQRPVVPHRVIYAAGQHRAAAAGMAFGTAARWTVRLLTRPTRPGVPPAEVFANGIVKGEKGHSLSQCRVSRRSYSEQHV